MGQEAFHNLREPRAGFTFDIETSHCGSGSRSVFSMLTKLWRKSTPSEVTGKEILICDSHVGCQLWQHALLRDIGLEPTIASLSGHKKYLMPSARKLARDEVRLVNAIRQGFGKGWRGWLKEELVDLVFHDERIYRCLDRFDYFLCSFPPSIGLLFHKAAQRLNKKLILNIAHRFNIGVQSPKQNMELFRLIEELHASDEDTLAVMSDYDYHYLRYYFDIEPPRLTPCCLHVPCQLVESTRPEVLIGPAHARQYGPLGSIDELNQKAREWSKGHGGEAPRFSHMKDLYPKYHYRQLQQHPAVVLFPYSVFSISMIELYELNIPMFVPSIEFLVESRLMNDRVLFPVYCTESQFRRFETRPKSNDYPYSPNDYSAEAQEYWLQYCHFYRLKNAVVWHSFEDLFAKLSEFDLARVRKNMYEENQANRNQMRDDWRRVLRLDCSPAESEACGTKWPTASTERRK